MLYLKYMLFMSFIFVFGEDSREENARSLVEIDYSLLAGQAERNKHDLLNFLNQSSVREQYKAMYCILLEKLLGRRSSSQNRRDQASKEMTEQKQKLMLGINEFHSSSYFLSQHWCQIIQTAQWQDVALCLPSINESSEAQRRVRDSFSAIIDDSPLSETRRIVFGHNTSIAAIPWQVSLREKTYPICGGSVVSDIWLLTAAHCLLRARSSDLSVRLGSSWKTHGGEMYDVKECYVHPRYVSKTKINDVGLVRLYSPLRFSNTVLPINVIDRETRLLADEVAIVSGWGKLQESGASATFLQSTMIRTIAMKHCLRSGLDRKAINPPSMFCAGSFRQPSPDACQGDSGGPLVKDGVLIGVVSWGLGCARGNFPGVYTRLSHPVIWDWVQSHLARKFERNATNN